MTHLLYVTPELLNKLRRHSAFVFWSPIVQNLPIRQIPLEERSFHPRHLPADNGSIYLTVDMKFIYFRDGMASFLYADQDLSFRFTINNGILRTLDGKQFTAIVGKIATISASNDAELVNAKQTYHTFFDSGAYSTVAAFDPDLHTREEGKPTSKRSRRKKEVEEEEDDEIVTEPTKRPSREEKEVPVKKTISAGAQISESLASEIYDLRFNKKQTYGFIAGKFGMDKGDVRKLCAFLGAQENRKKRSMPVSKPAPKRPNDAQALKSILDEYPKAVCEQIVHMKNVSKKSYTYVAKKFNVPIKTIRVICSQNLKRPRLKSMV